MATGFKSGGRPPGGRNKATLARERAAKAVVAAANESPGAFLGDAWTLLCSIYKCNELPIEIRLEAAKAAIRYERAPIAPVAAPEAPEAVEDKARRLHLLIAEMKSTIGGDSSNGHAAVPDLN